MKIVLNGEEKEVPEGVNLRKMLEHFSLPTQRVAIELNREVVRRQQWDSIVVTDDDKIEVIHFVGGG